MTVARRRAWAGVALLLAGSAWAQGEAVNVPAVEPPSGAASAPRRTVEGAIGLVLNVRPEYLGASRHHAGLTPGFYIRWRRLTFSNQGGFATRDESEDVQRGLDATLVRRENLRLNATLRVDPGRSRSKSDALQGVHEVPSTLRGRLALTWRPAPDWQLATGWSADLLGRGTGAVVDLGVAREFKLSRDASLWLGGGASWADGRQMRAQFGITPEDAARSGYAVYAPGSGLRDARLSLDWRQSFGRRWVAFAGVSLGRMLGPTVDSPLTTDRVQPGAGGGLAWRF